MFSPASGGGSRTRSRRIPVVQQHARSSEGHVTDSPTSGLVVTTRTMVPGGVLPPAPTPALPKHSSMAFRMTPILKSGDRSISDGSDPVFVCDFPHQVRTLLAEATPVQRPELRGGMDGESGLSWSLYKSQLFIWSHLNSHAPSDCKILNIPSQLCVADGHDIDSKHGNSWFIRIVNRQVSSFNEMSLVKGCVSAGLVMCSQKSLAVVYWPDIFKDTEVLPLVNTGADDKLGGSAAHHVLDDRCGAASGRRSSSAFGGYSSSKLVNSLIVSGTSNLDCVAIASCSSNDLWRFDCSTSGISHHCITREVEIRNEQSFGPFDFNNLTGGRSLAWRSRAGTPNDGWREFLLLTSKGIECWDVQLSRKERVVKAWSYDISEDVEIQKDLAGQKQVWLLDLQVEGNTLTVLAASLSKDRVTSSSYMQYSLFTFLCTPPPNRQGGYPESQAKCVKRKAPVQVILPKARVEEEEFLYSMQLRVGGKPAGSAMILAGDGTATISHNLHGVIRLYQFDLAWDAGRAIDATVVPSLEENDEGAWLVLTEKAGVWAIPEKAVLLGAVEPPERSLSRKGSANDDSAKEQRRRLALANSDNGVSADTKERVLKRIVSQRPLQDEEAEATIGRLFQHFLTTRQVNGVLEKLQKAGALEGEDEMNIFARFSKSIVDTIAKQWASGGGAGAAVMMAIASQLAEKQRRHQQYLNFLAASKCHDVLQLQQRSSLHTIMEHGEKLVAITMLKDMHNSRAQVQQQNEQTGSVLGDSDRVDVCGALWETIQLVGEKARRKNVMLMDKEKIEVFFTRVSDLEELFLCVEEHGHAIIGQEQSIKSQCERLCEISDACTVSIRAAIHYRDSQQAWYPSPEGLTPWYCRGAVRSGIWKVASLIMDLQTEVDPQLKEKLMACLEEVTDILLEGYTGAIAAKVELEEEYRGLQIEYWSRRDTIFTVLQQHAREMADIAAQRAGGGEAGEQQRLEVLRNCYGSVLGMARRHAGYQTLWEICIDLNDMDCLRKLMHESMGLKEGRFSNYVFEQFLKKGQHAKLLRLGEEFKEELVSFLHGQKSLSWLHDIYLKRFNIASNTMHSLALSNSKMKVPITQEQMPAGILTLAQRRKLLYLAKLAALAGGAREAHKALQIDADLGILAVQELAVEFGLASTEVLSPLQLVELCLNSGQRELVIRALDVFALAGDAFRRGNKSMLESTWLKLANEDEWIKMRQASEEEGWSDEQQYEALKTTALFIASKYCYGGAASVYGMPFEDVLPAFRDTEDKSTLRAEPGMAGSVEEVLMQHQDFPEAGEAMLTALRMGKGLELAPDENIDSMVEI